MTRFQTVCEQGEGRDTVLFMTLRERSAPVWSSNQTEGKRTYVLDLVTPRISRDIAMALIKERGGIKDVRLDPGNHLQLVLISDLKGSLLLERLRQALWFLLDDGDKIVYGDALELTLRQLAATSWLVEQRGEAADFTAVCAYINRAGVPGLLGALAREDGSMRMCSTSQLDSAVRRLIGKAVNEVYPAASVKVEIVRKAVTRSPK